MAGSTSSMAAISGAIAAGITTFMVTNACTVVVVRRTRNLLGGWASVLAIDLGGFFAIPADHAGGYALTFLIIPHLLQQEF